jgi:K+-sensing histidine kinase KdpD
MRSHAHAYVAMLLIVTACSLLGWLSHAYDLTEANVVMLFLAGVALVATRYGQGPAIAAAVLSVVVFEFFFVVPSFSFAIRDAQYFITLGVMLGIGLLISTLTARLRSQLRAAHRAQLAVQQAQSQIEAEQMRNSMLSAVSHDLRTPLATIAVTASSLLEDTGSIASKQDLLRTVVDESHRLCRQVENLLRHACLTAGAVQLKRNWEALDELIEAAVSRVGPHLGTHRVAVNIGSEIVPIWVAGELMEHLFVNLLDNAIRYTPPGSTIEISATQRRDRLEITIADNGPGLPPGSELKVFDQFFRGTTSIADGHRGIGLGLSICKAIVQAHDGQMTARNREPYGAQFVITLPCQELEPETTFDQTRVFSAGQIV